jgi:polyisoprenoid-binding protein YceI
MTRTNRLVRAATGASLLVALVGAIGFASNPGGTSAPAGDTADTTPFPASAASTWSVVDGANEVRYRVREQLAGRDLPNDAIGATKQVAGQIVLDESGAIVADASKITVTVTDITSDSNRRDGYVRRRILETEAHPTVTFEPTAFRELTGAIPASGERTFAVVGDLTVRDSTRATTWQVSAQFANGRVSGTAKTAFTFDDFGIPQPRVAIVLSVADTIQLEYDFNFAAQP